MLLNQESQIMLDFFEPILIKKKKKKKNKNIILINVFFL